MPPKQKTAVKMSLAEFVGTGPDNSTSWADDMEDSYPPRPGVTGGYRASGPSSTTVTGFGALGDSRLSRGPAPGGSSAPPQREYREFRDSRDPVPMPTQPPWTAHVANLSFQATDDEIRNLFEATLGCQLKSIRVGYDVATGGRKGFGYIDFETLADLQIALDNSGVDFIGRSLRISVAEKERPARGEPPSFSRSMFGSLATREPPATPAAPSQADTASQWRKASSPATRTPSERAPSVVSEMQSSIPVGVSNWRSARSAQPSAGQSPARESSNPPASPAVTSAAAAPPVPKSRQETLAKLLDGDNAAPTSSSNNPFGDARPVDTVARQRELEDRQVKRQQEERARRQAEREKASNEKKEAEERRARESAAKLEEAAQRRRAAQTSAPAPAAEPAAADEAEVKPAQAKEEVVAPAQKDDSPRPRSSNPTEQNGANGNTRSRDSRPPRPPREDAPVAKHLATSSWRSAGAAAAPAAAPASGSAAAPASSAEKKESGAASPASGEDGWNTVGPRTRPNNSRRGNNGQNKGGQGAPPVRRGGDGFRNHRGGAQRNNSERNNAPAAPAAAPAAAAEAAAGSN